MSAAVPLVSCIMPTANRRVFIPTAIRLFLAQNYPNTELVIIDDGDYPVADLVPTHPAIHYHRTGRHPNLGAKRNAAVEASHGDIIIHWDDDDWHAANRISTQVEALSASGADISGISLFLIVDPRTQAAWECHFHPSIMGASLCYHRNVWRAHPFANLNRGEDGEFIRHARSEKVRSIHDNSLYIVLMHSANRSGPCVTDWRVWRPVDFSAVMAMAGPLWQPPVEQPRTISSRFEMIMNKSEHAIISYGMRAAEAAGMDLEEWRDDQRRRAAAGAIS